MPVEHQLYTHTPARTLTHVFYNHCMHFIATLCPSGIYCECALCILWMDSKQIIQATPKRF